MILNDSCLHVNKIADFKGQCEFVNTNEDCAGGSEFIFNYVELFYCKFGSKNSVVTVLFSSVWLLILFTVLGVTADDFLCSALLVIAKTLRLSQNIAGVTFLAFGNGAPDIFSSFVGIRKARTELVIGELFGAGFFVTTIVVGFILIGNQFSMMSRPFLRDIGFYLVALYLVWVMFWFGSIGILHAAGFIFIYVVYIVVVIVCRLVRARFIDKVTEKKGTEEISTTIPIIAKHSAPFHVPVIIEPSEPITIERVSSSYSQFSNNFEQKDLTTSSTEVRNLGASSLTSDIDGNSYSSSLKIKRNSVGSLRRHSVHHHFDNALYSFARNLEPDGSEDQSVVEQLSSVLHEAFFPAASPQSVKPESSMTLKLPTMYNTMNQKQNSLASLIDRSERDFIDDEELDSYSEFVSFLVHISPFHYEELRASNWWQIILIIWKCPIYFILNLTIPVVDYENHRNNWCRILNCLHFVTSPLAIVLLTHSWSKNICGIPLPLLVFPIGSVLGIVVFFLTEHEKVPRFHSFFSYVGFIVSVVWIYAFANEVVDLLRAVGILFSISDVILGLTVLAWGNSLGDLVTNLSMARQGFPRMAISACFGGPLLNLLLGIGIPYLIVIIQDGGEIELNSDLMVNILYGVLTLSLISTLFIFIKTGFKSRKWHGFLLIIIYFVYLLFAVIHEWGR